MASDDRQANAHVACPDPPSPPGSESTVEFSDEEFERRVQKYLKPERRERLTELPPIEDLITGPSTRLIGISLLPPYQSDAPIYQVEQTASNPRAKLEIPSISFTVLFDPASDEILISNRRSAVVSFHRSGGSDIIHAPQNKHIPLPPGRWQVREGETRLFEFYTLQRRVSVSLRPAQAPTTQVSSPSLKRRGPPDQHEDLIDTKKSNRTGTNVSSTPAHAVAALVQAQRTEPKAAAISSAYVATARHTEASDTVTGNPLLQLPLGHAMDISGSKGTEYTLTKQHSIMDQPYTEVFSALQIGLPISSQATAICHEDPTVRVPDVVVVKVLKPQKQHVDRVADMWLREASTHQGLIHPKIVRLYDSDARFFSLYMEHVVAQDLAHHRSADDYYNGPDAPEAITRLVRDCTSAILYIHSQGIHHNDIKPRNILFDLHRGAMICDFGHARPAKMDWVPGGTPAYLAPELISPDERHASCKWDSWALGVTFLYVLRKLRLPEMCANWLIGAMVRWKDQPEGRPESEMRRWLVRVMRARDEIRGPGDAGLRAVHSCVLGLLEEEPARRLDMSEALNIVSVATR